MPQRDPFDKLRAGSSLDSRRNSLHGTNPLRACPECSEGVTPKRRSASALAALLVVVALGVTSTLTPREAFSGFASSTVVTIVAFFILAEALRSTGMTDPIMLLLPIFWPWPPVNYPGGNRV